MVRRLADCCLVDDETAETNAGRDPASGWVPGNKITRSAVASGGDVVHPDQDATFRCHGAFLVHGGVFRIGGEFSLLGVHFKPLAVTLCCCCS